MRRPFLGVKTWRQLKTLGFNSKATLLIILKFIKYQVGLMIKKPTELSMEWIPKMPLSSSVAPLHKFCGGWPEEEIHAHPRNLSSAISFNFVYLPLTLPLNPARPIILNSNSTVLSLINLKSL
jgi:hypothetical protein